MQGANQQGENQDRVKALVIMIVGSCFFGEVN